ncbi:PqqD family protein [Streptosporangiaceae bacterium NEAU-GS5]|nr:PqqD family protein [Streptosporangiaceae bacterium NEAU-GS5]
MIYVRHPQVLWDDVDGRVVLCHTETVRYYELNAVGATIWRACEGIGMERLVGLLAAAHSEVDRARLADDAHSFVAALMSENLLCPGEG